jgi:Flp pilus assembly protein TadG
MTRTGNYRRLGGTRRGTTVVETALVLPVFLLFMLGLIELGHAQMV